MIFITGDTHGFFEGRFSTTAFHEQKEMTKEDRFYNFSLLLNKYSDCAQYRPV